jgi:hypothetical protein
MIIGHTSHEGPNGFTDAICRPTGMGISLSFLVMLTFYIDIRHFAKICCGFAVKRNLRRGFIKPAGETLYDAQSAQ